MRYSLALLLFVACGGGGRGGIDPGPEPDASAFPPPNTACVVVEAGIVEAGVADADAGDAGLWYLDAGTTDPCSPPPSTCATQGWLVYYDNGRCVNGTCAWDTLFQMCSGGCYMSGCRQLFTAAVEPFSRLEW